MAYVFDGPNKIISLTSGTTVLNVKELWSRWVDWLPQGDNSKWLPAFSQVGGNTIDASEGTEIPTYIYLLNGWKLRPQETDHTLKVTAGILLVEGGGDPFLDTVGNFTVRVNYAQPVQAVTISIGAGSNLTFNDLIKANFITG